jgi:uncharacterized protein
MLTEHGTEADVDKPPHIHTWQVLAIIGALGGVIAIGSVIGGEIGHFMFAGLEVLPFALLAFFAYLGVQRRWARVVSLVLLFAIVVGVSSVALLLTLSVLDASNGDPAGRDPVATSGMIAIGLLVSVLMGSAFLARPVRLIVGRFIPLDPNSFVHMVAGVAIVSLTLVGFVPLFFLGEPPLLSTIAGMSDDSLAGGRGDAGSLRDTLYGLVWLVPCAIVATGFGVKRGLGQSLKRLGLVKPTRSQMIGGIVLAVLLVVGVQVLDLAIDWFWSLMGWQRTDSEAFGRLIAFALSPIGAVVIGVTAGLGEELAVRGVLQPRFGILLSNVFFTGMHAFQYSWDALLVVFLIGLVLGVIRQRSNTTTSAVVHGLYDFLLIMAVVLEVPGLGG